MQFLYRHVAETIHMKNDNEQMPDQMSSKSPNVSYLIYF